MGEQDDSQSLMHFYKGAVLRLKKSPTTRDRLCSPLPVVLVTDPGSRKALYSVHFATWKYKCVYDVCVYIYCEYIMNIDFIAILHEHMIYSYNIIAYRIILHEHVYIHTYTHVYSSC